MRESASRGFWIGSRKPYGYNRVMVQDGAKKRPTLELDPDTSPVVERIFDMAQAGKGMLPIAETLNDEGVAAPQTSSGPRTPSTSSSRTRSRRAR